MILADMGKANFRYLFFVSIVFLLLMAVPAFTQRVNVQATVDKEEILIGEEIQFSLNIYIPKGASIHYPLFRRQQLGSFEIIESGSIDTTFNSNESITLKQEITLTSYDTGINVLPGIRVPYYYGATFDTATTSHIDIRVAGVAIDLTQDIKDIRPPVDVRFSWREIIPYLFYIISFIVLVGAGIYAWIYFRDNNKPDELKDNQTIEPAHISALRQLDFLKQENLIKKKQIREFHSRLTDNIRRYIQNRFEIKAMENTSEEILAYLKQEKVDQHSFEALEQILILADQVKFAKVKPSDRENEQSMNNAYYFVNNTKETSNASKVQSDHI